MLVSKRVCFSAVAALALFASQARAVTVNFLGHTANSRQVNFSHFGDVRNNEYAGEMNITVDGQPFIAYCVDLDNDAPNSWQASIMPVNVINGGKAIGWLYDNFASTVTTPNQGAALQLAIWEVLDDSPGVLDVNLNNFKFLGSTPGGQFNNIRNLAINYLSALPAPAVLAAYVPQSVIVFSTQVNTAQHMIIPEPSSLSALALGALILIRRRSR